MVTDIYIKNSIFAKVKNNTQDFFYGKIYPVILALITFLFWVCDLQLIGFSVLVLIGCFLLIFFDDFTPIIPILLLIPMSFRNTEVLNDFALHYVVLGVAFICLVANFIIHPLKWKHIDILFLGFFVLIGAMLLGGIRTEHSLYYWKGLPFILLSGIAMLAVHFVITNRVVLNSHVDLRRYLCYSLVVAVNLACFQLFYAKLHVALYGEGVFFFPSFCWANTNHIGNLILIAVPLLAYLMLDTKYLVLSVIDVAIMYFALFLSESDGSIGILSATSPVILYFTCKHASKRNKNTLFLVAKTIICLVVLGVAYFLLFQGDLVQIFITKLLDDNHRLGLYEYAIELFKLNPIFGAGQGYGSNTIESFHRGYFHSTFFHAIGTMGLFGLLSFIFFYYARIRHLARKSTLLGLFTMIAFMMFAVYALIDNGEFNLVILYMTTVISTVGLINKRGKDKQPLPLFNKSFKF